MQVDERIEESVLRSFGHIEKLEDSRDAKKVHEGVSGGLTVKKLNRFSE